MLAGISLVAYAKPDGIQENISNKTERYIKFVYDKISFKKINKLKYETFAKAFFGYLNLKEAGKVHGNAILSICDFSLSSNEKRLWVLDLHKKKVLFNTLVAHGAGSGEEFATKFSNIEESHQSSLGFYTTGEIYMGDNGYSLKLHGQDGNWNNKAFDRAIVMHGADYVDPNFAVNNNRLGRSHGCPAIARSLAEPIINRIANGHVLFIYHPTKAYLKTSYWLTNKINNLPQEADYLDLIMPEPSQNKWATKLVQPSDSLVIKNNNQRIVNLMSVDISDSINLKTAYTQKVIETQTLAIPLKNNTTITPNIKKEVPVRDKEFLYLKY